MFTIAQIAQRFGVSRRTVARWIEKRELIAKKKDRLVRIEPEALAAFERKWRTA